MLSQRERNNRLIGKKFNRLTILGRDEVNGGWWLKCDCGTRKRKLCLHDIKSGKFKSCGCGLRSVKNNLMGLRFGSLTVIQLVDHDFGRGKKRWLTRCDCGNKPIIAATHLMTGNTKSCGCLRIAMGRIKDDTMIRKHNGRYSHTSPEYVDR